MIKISLELSKIEKLLTKEVNMPKAKSPFKIKSLKKLKKEGQPHTLLKDKVVIDHVSPGSMSIGYSNLSDTLIHKVSYAEFLATATLGYQDIAGTKKFFDTYGQSEGLGYLSYTNATLILNSDAVTIVDEVTSEHVIVCESMSWEQLSQVILSLNLITKLTPDNELVMTDAEGAWVKDKGWVKGEGWDIKAGIAESDTSDMMTMPVSPKDKLGMKVLVENAVLHKPSKPSLLSGKHDFYDVVEGTSGGSKYVVVAKGINDDANIAMRYKTNTLSLRCDPVPKTLPFLKGLHLLGFTDSSGTHLSCHISMAEGDAMTRYMLLLQAVLTQYCTLCDMDLEKIKAKGA